MTASSRFGYSMMFGAVASALTVAYLSAKRHAQLAVSATKPHLGLVSTAAGARVAAFAAGTIVLGLLTFAVACAARRKPAPQRSQPAPRASRYERRYGGMR
jgi:hypothetical protein